MSDRLKCGLVRLGGFVLCLAVTLGVALLIFGVFLIVEDAEESRCVEADENIEERIRLGLYLFSDSISFEGEKVGKEELCSSFAHVIKDDPYLFFVSESMSYTYDSDGNIISMLPEYSMTRGETLIALFYCEKRLSEICESVAELDGEEEKAAVLHDYICKNFDYDEKTKNNDIYTFLLGGKGTCRAYSMLYTALLRKCGVDATYEVSDEGTDKAGHMWNIVRIGGESYRVDVTWDAVASGESVSRKYFMIVDAPNTR